jgi:hypothetical protein
MSSQRQPDVSTTSPTSATGTGWERTPVARAQRTAWEALMKRFLVV